MRVLPHVLRNDPILSVKNLSVEFFTERGVVRAVRNLSLDVNEGEILGIVGESGSGKSASLLSILGLVPYPGKIVSGSVKYKSRDESFLELRSLPQKSMRSIRGKDISMVFQDPMACLNPAHRIGDQILEALEVHGMFNDKTRAQRKAFLSSLLSEVGIPYPEHVLNLYPHQLSGGMQQRVVIAIALVTNPRLILMDEPTTALDVTIQAEILRLIERINRRRHTAIVLVTHDLAVASSFCHRIAVMYAGEIVEEGPSLEVTLNPLHPYTKGLLRSMPQLEKGKRLRPIPGQVPNLVNVPKGCAFHPRCPYATPSCAGEASSPELIEVSGLNPSAGFSTANADLGKDLGLYDSRKVKCSQWLRLEDLESQEISEERIALGDER